jgi:pectate lyase
MRFLPLVVLALGLLVGPPTATARTDFGRQTLAPNDGWASASGGTSGGAAADTAHVFTVQDRRGLVAALGDGDAPKIIYVDGEIEGNVDDDGSQLGCDNYATDGYTLAAYVLAYDPAVWGTTSVPSGALEDARRASQRRQAARVQIPVGSNTTIVGVNDAAFMLGINLVVNGSDNVIIRNLNFSDAYDCFPQWDPTDGAQGNWNAQYDNISLLGASHVWIDHNAFDDGLHPDKGQPSYLGRPFQVHDGAVDITRGSDLVTVSWNEFTEHDKTMLIGATDNPASDAGKLRVSVHHNLFAGIGQRGPRVRFGEVHVYNNVYEIINPTTFVYSWGVGVDSKIFAENNVFVTQDVRPEQVVRVFNGTALHASGTLFGPLADLKLVDVVAAYDAAHGQALQTDVGWTPTTSLVTRMDLPSSALVDLLRNESGPASE